MQMYHYIETLTNTAGDSLPGLRVRVTDTQGSVVPIYADENNTPISVVSGIANQAVSDESGVVDFFIAEGVYNLQCYDADGQLIRTFRAVGFRGRRGDPGGNIKAVGRFTDLGAMTIPAGTDTISTTGYDEAGTGAATYKLDSDQATANTGDMGLWRRQDAQGRWWRLSVAEPWLEMFGLKSDVVANTSERYISHTTDNAPAIRAAFDWVHRYKRTNLYSSSLAGSAVGTIRVGLGRFYTSETIVLKYGTVQLIGQGVGHTAGPQPTVFYFGPAATNGIELHRADTIGDTTGPVTESAGGSVIRGICVAATSASNKIGFRLRQRGDIDGNTALFWVDYGFYIYATAGSGTPANVGNANLLRLRDNMARNCGIGIYFNGADTNAVMNFGFNGEGCGSWAVYDSAFINVTHIGHHCDANGRLGHGSPFAPNTKASLVADEGNRYFLIQGQEANGPTAKPSISPTVWEYLEPGGEALSLGIPTWVSGMEVQSGGSYYCASTTSVWLGCYAEGRQGKAQATTGGPVWIGHAAVATSTPKSAIQAGVGWFPNEVRSNKLTLRGSGSNLALSLFAVIHNTASANSGRAAGQVFAAGYEADGVTPHNVAAIYGVNTSNSLTALGRLLFMVGDGAAGLQEAAQFDGPTLAWRPGADNLWSLGTAALRMSQLFAGTGTINTSDQRHKLLIEAISDAVLDAWGNVGWSAFKFDHAVAAKGEDGARWHHGLIAQQVHDALEAEGLDPFCFGLLCYDEWEEWTDVLPSAAGLAAGDDIDEANPEHWTVTVNPAGNLWGIRYEEALAIEAAFQRRRYDQLAARVTALEAA